MYRIALAIALSAAILVPGSVGAHSERCSVAISPSAGSPTDAYRVTVSNVPVDPEGGSVEVRTNIRRLGSREGSIIFAFLFPGTTEFNLDYHSPSEGPGEPPLEPLEPGRYQVSVTTPHLNGACQAIAHFLVYQSSVDWTYG